MADFCQKHLKTDYRTFQYRMRKARYYPAEVIYICWLLDDSCENIFGRTFMDLVLINDGPEDAIDYVRRRIAEADVKQREHLLNLIGMSVSDYKVEGIVVPVEKPKGKHIEKLRVVEKIELPKKEETAPEKDFYIDIDLRNPLDEIRYGRKESDIKE